MTSQYTLRVTLACPESLVSQANQFALAVGESVHDDRTFGALRYQDDQGNLYSVASTVATEGFPMVAQASLADIIASKPHLNNEVDISAAEAAQSALVVWVPEIDLDTGEVTTGVQATPNALTAVIYPNALQAIDWLGLEAVQDDLGL